MAAERLGQETRLCPSLPCQRSRIWVGAIGTLSESLRSPLMASLTRMSLAKVGTELCTVVFWRITLRLLSRICLTTGNKLNTIISFSENFKN